MSKATKPVRRARATRKTGKLPPPFLLNREGRRMLARVLAADAASAAHSSAADLAREGMTDRERDKRKSSPEERALLDARLRTHREAAQLGDAIAARIMGLMDKGRPVTFADVTTLSVAGLHTLNAERACTKAIRRLSGLAAVVGDL